MKYILTMMVALLLPSWAMAAPDVRISVHAEKVVMVEEHGKQVEKRVPADDVMPGDVIVYTLQFENRGDETAHQVVFNDPIPEGTAYIVDSAFGPGSEISFSIDGKNFKQPSLLVYTVEQNGKTRELKASPEQYTHIRWVVRQIPPGKSGMVGFRVRVK